MGQPRKQRCVLWVELMARAWVVVGEEQEDKTSKEAWKLGAKGPEKGADDCQRL